MLISEEVDVVAQLASGSRRAIVCGVAWRQEAEIAWAVASELALRLGARLVAVHVAPRREAVAAAKQRLHGRVRQADGPAADKALVVAGQPGQELARIARDEEADVIVIGAHHGPEPLVSVSTEAVLAELAPCPVVAIRHPDDVVRLVELLEGGRVDRARCTVCGQPDRGPICSSCQRRIGWEAMRHTWHPEGFDRHGAFAIGAARALGPVAPGLSRSPDLAPAAVPPPAPPQQHRRSFLERLHLRHR